MAQARSLARRQSRYVEALLKDVALNLARGRTRQISIVDEMNGPWAFVSRQTFITELHDVAFV